MTCKVCLWADTRTERRNRGIYRNMLRLRIRIFHIRAPRGMLAMAIRPYSELISVSLGLIGGTRISSYKFNMKRTAGHGSAGPSRRRV